MDTAIGCACLMCGIPLVVVGHQSEQCGNWPGFLAGLCVGCPMIAMGIALLF